MENDKKVILSIKDLVVKFHVRGRVLTAIRGISLDIYENESIAIVGESGSGKSVFTKTFAGMLDSNGFIDEGSIIFNDDDIARTRVKKNRFALKLINFIQNKLDTYSKLLNGANTYKKILELKSEYGAKLDLTEVEKEEIDNQIEELNYQATEKFNQLLTLDRKNQKDEITALKAEIAEHKNEIKELENRKKELISKHKEETNNDVEYLNEYKTKLAELEAKYKEEISQEMDPKYAERNKRIAKEIYLSIGRYPKLASIKLSFKLMRSFKKAMKLGVDLDDPVLLGQVFDTVVFRVAYTDEDDEYINGLADLDISKVKYARDWQQIRGSKVATVFQDPMTSLNPIITIGKQITSVIMKHQNCSLDEARIRAIDLMGKVGIPNPEKRFDDYPFQYSGGMRQRIVIAIALSCQPKILICDEPTTALDVTIQAQILKLIKDLQREFNYTIVFITHDLGVVANIADRVAVLYAGQIVEIGTCEDVFYDPRHPYTWALLSSLPQLAERGTELYSIAGTPPSLYNKIIGDPFAPRNPYCLRIDTLMDAPMFKVSDTHYAKTWLLDPRSPKVEKPEAIQNIHEKLLKVFNI